MLLTKKYWLKWSGIEQVSRLSEPELVTLLQWMELCCTHDNQPVITFFTTMATTQEVQGIVMLLDLKVL